VNRPRRSRVGPLLVGLGTVALVLALSAVPVQAQAPDQVGWWFELATGPLALPVPIPVVPDGGLLVQEGPAGPTAYGALRYRAVAGSSTLELGVAAGSTTQTASLQACKTTSTWTPTSGPGAWTARPSFGAPCAPGIISSDAKFVAFNLDATFLAAGVLDVAIVPIDGATPFSVTFDAPPADSLVANASGGSPPPTAPSPGVTTPATIAGSPGGPVANLPRPGAASPAGAPAAAPAVAPAASSDTGSGVANRVLKIAGLGDPDRGARAFALGGASAIVIGWWLTATRAAPAPRLLGALAGGGASADTNDRGPAPRVGGIGRFARTRAANPRGLR
jgi:hypothetical protein